MTPQAAQSRRSDDRSAERISGRPIRLQRPVRRLVPQPVAHARLRAAGAPAALVGPGPRHAHGLETRQADVGLVARHARQPAIDHHAHAFDGERGFGDRGGEHDLAPPRQRRGDGPVLLSPVERSIERREVDGRVGDALAQQPLDAADFALAGQEHEQRSGISAERPHDGVGDELVDAPVGVSAEVARLDRKRAPLRADDGRIAEEARDARSVQAWPT